jgi:hypothetical protein
MKRLDKILLQRYYLGSVYNSNSKRSFSILKNGADVSNRIQRILDSSSSPPATATTLITQPSSTSSSSNSSNSSLPLSSPPPSPSSSSTSSSSSSLAALDAALTKAEADTGGLSDHEHSSSELADFETANPTELKRSVLQVIRDLEDRHAVHTATMQTMERSREWKDYDAHVHFELQLLRLRYSSGETSAEAMTSQRRAQMAAHLRAKQLEVMNEHATEAANQFVKNLSEKEKEELRATLSRVDASTTGLAAGAGPKTPGGSVFDDELRSALNELSVLLPALTSNNKGRG